MQKILEKASAVPPIEYRPEVRWWLASGSHTDQTLRDEIDQAHKYGFGGMEFLAMPEDNIDRARYGWGSEEWVHDSKIVVEETTKRGMSVSFTSGTNWSNANVPTIDPDHPAAAKELNYVSEDVNAGKTRSGPLPQIDLPYLRDHNAHSFFGKQAEVKKQVLAAVVAARIVEKSDKATVLDLETLDLTDKVSNNTLEWTAPEGDWRLFVFWMHGTGQTAAPSSTENYTVNYMDPDGCEELVNYWKDVVLTPDLTEVLSKNDRAQMYMDSLELTVYGAGGLFWGRTVAAEFKKRHGYSVTPYLPFLVRVVKMMACDAVFTFEPPASSRTTIDKVRFDLVNTFTDLYIENMLRPFRTFLNKNNIALRSEISYGLPFELTRPGPDVDGIETESLEFGAQVDAYRLMSGVANLFGKQYSSETGACTRNLMLNHQFYDQIINTQLAVGCTKTLLHGWASMAGAEGTTWPGHEGMLPMFSERFDTRQPAAEFYSLWSNALGRMQYILRQGLPRVDVGILRTDHCTDNLCGLALKDDEGYRIPDEVAYGRMWMRNRENHWWQDLGMQDAGWTYEFFDGELLLDKSITMEGGVVQPKGPGYQAVIIYQSTLNPDVAKHVLRWAQAGLKVLLVHDTRELKLLQDKLYFHHPKAAAGTQGLDGRDDELAKTIAELLRLPNTAESTIKLRRSVLFENSVHLREDGDKLYLYLYHFLYETGKATDVTVTFDGEGTVYHIDCHTPAVKPCSDLKQRDSRTMVNVHLRPGETTILAIDRSQRVSNNTPKAVSTSTVQELTEWDVTIESWDAGEVEVITEDRGLGYTTTQHKPHPAISKIPLGTIPNLKPWNILDQVGPDVSGIGEYRTTLTLKSIDANGRYILDLGSTCGGLGSVCVNSSSPCGFDTSAPQVDITSFLCEGKNDVVVRVSSSLNNRLRARKYYDSFKDDGVVMIGPWKSENEKVAVREYGLVGPVVLLCGK